MNIVLRVFILSIAFIFYMSTPQANAQSRIDKDKQNIEADKMAIQKDNEAIARAQKKLSRQRAEKASHKADGFYGKQAADSLHIGSTKTVIHEKTLEKKSDMKMLEHHKKNLKKDSSRPSPTP